MSKHTQGPWKLFGKRVYGPDAIPAHDSEDTAYRDLIATVENETDARLIAAAPEMLEILESILNRRESPPMKKIRALVTRVKGGQHGLLEPERT